MSPPPRTKPSDSTLAMNQAVHKPAAGSEGQQYKEVRGLSRGLSLLKALNRMPGGLASTSELARACAIHRTTAKRLLETMRMEGLVATGEREGQYHLTRDVQLLSAGYAEEDWLTQVARPALKAAAPTLVWPCNVATVEGGFMLIRESTRRFSPLSYQHALVGERLPILHSSLGRAYLAASAAEELEALLSDLYRRADLLGFNTCDLADVHQTIAETRARGYAVSSDISQAKFSSVAVPIFSGKRLLGALNLVFTKYSQSAGLVEAKYIEQLKKLAHAIGVSSRSWIDE